MSKLRYLSEGRPVTNILVFKLRKRVKAGLGRTLDRVRKTKEFRGIKNALELGRLLVTRIRHGSLYETLIEEKGQIQESPRPQVELKVLKGDKK